MAQIWPEAWHCRPGPKTKVAWPARGVNACSRRCHHAREWRGGAAMGSSTAALSRCHEHEGSQEKVLGKVRAAGSHRVSRATTGRQSRAARRRLNGSGAPVVPQGSEVVLQLREGGRGGVRR
jgi:hypothetical protein